jgi:phosphoglycerate dehydrogenase-like enzyme
MTARPFPDRASVTICFAHVAYRLGERFAARKTGVRAIEVRGFDDFSARIPEADVAVVSGLWRNELIKRATKLRFIQSIGAGVDEFDRDALRARDIRLASAQGVNERAVSQHAMALMLALMRHIPAGRDNQRRRHWRGMISDLTQREDELGGKTLLIVGLGRIGSRLATLARAFGLRVIATKRDPSKGSDAADLVVPDAKLSEVLPQADIVALTCPLTPQTEKLIGQAALAAMKPSAYLINVARGRVVDEPALIAALNAGRIAGAALDCTVEEPLPESSPLWDFDNVLITPHTAGETRRYEDNVLDILLENLERLWRGETELKNQIV